MWGQMAFPAGYKNHLQDFWADYGNTIIPPMIAFHGFNDKTLPINTTPIIFAPDHLVPVPGHGNINYSPYNSESNCLLNSPTSYKLDGDETSVDLIGAGSKGMYDIFHTSAINQRIELYVDCEMAHGLDDDVTCITCNGNYPRKGVNGVCKPCTPLSK